MPSYDNIAVLGDFNSEVNEPAMQDFCTINNLKNLVKETTCFKNPLNPSCIDLILTNRTRSFQNTLTIETGISDCHKMTVTLMKTYFKKKQPRIISYRDYKKFSNDKFILELESNPRCYNLDKIKFDDFENIFMNVLDKYAPTICTKLFKKKSEKRCLQQTKPLYVI